MSLSVIAELSRLYGSDPRFVLAGGGNSSYKDEKFLYVKPSGVFMSELKETDYVKMDRSKVREIFNIIPPVDPVEREAVVKRIMEGAVSHDSSGRPSVEAPLHEVISYTFIVHLHPAMVNGMTCGRNGREKCAELFPDALWVDYTDPGYSLAVSVRKSIVEYSEKKGRQPQLIMLQNHGVFAAADNADALKRILNSMFVKLEEYYAGKDISIELDPAKLNNKHFVSLVPRIRSWIGDKKGRMTIRSSGYFNVSKGPLTPDHIVYSKSFPLISDLPDREKIARFAEDKGYKPLIVAIPGKAVFSAGRTVKEALTAELLAKDAALVQHLAEGFGGCNYLSENSYKFIENWEVESYRKKVASENGKGRLVGKNAIVTGAAQGFGFGIAQGLAGEGAFVAVADVNLTGAQKAADEINLQFGKECAFAVEVNITNENSIVDMIAKVIETCGGIDLFIANAGVLKAGPVKNFSKKDWDFVTDVNYTGYFLCVKHVSQSMSLQNAEGGDWTDIVQVNSKSGLEGSSRNAAYAGSKFGTIGLTQSFALELIDDKIKVNSICPGNYFEGPLWSDPDKGLFVQYLNSGKVPGAKDIDDVKKFYEKKVPMGRGCYPEDVVKAIVYCVEQKYETGQAIPVAGGQVMLN